MLLVNALAYEGDKMRKLLLFLIFVFLLPSILGALPEGTYGSGLYGKGLYGVQSSAKATFTTDIEIQKNVTTNIEANQSNTTLEIVTNSLYSGFVTIVRYDSAPSGVGSSPASALNKYISIGTESIDLNYSVIRVQYSNIELSNANLQEDTMRLYKWNGSEWIKFDGVSIGGVDTANNIVFANTTSFSTWGIFGNIVPAPTPSPAPSGGGGGGGGTYIPSTPSAPITYILNLIKGQVYDFNVDGKIHTLEIKEINVVNETSRILFKSELTELLLKLGVSDYINYDNDSFYDLKVTLTKIYGSELVEITIKTIHVGISGGGIIERPIKEPVPEVVPELPYEEYVPTEVLPKEEPQEAPQKQKFKFKNIMLIIALLLILFVISFKFGKYIILKYFKKDKKEDDTNKRDKRENQH